MARAVTGQPAHDRAEVGSGTMLGQEPPHREAAMSVAPTAADLEHHGSTFRDIASSE
jgi:hypothetical protein